MSSIAGLFACSRNLREEETSDPFLIRLQANLKNERSTYADIAKACFDALVRVQLCTGVMIALPNDDKRLNELGSSVLDKHGLKRRSSGDIVLQSMPSDLGLLDVFRLEERRRLHHPKMDQYIKHLFKDKSLNTYQGDGQKQAIRTILQSPTDCHIFVNLPTGCGKSLIFQSLGLVEDQKLTICIVPTVALAMEQGERFRQVLITKYGEANGNYSWYSGLADIDKQNIKVSIRDGKQRLLFCSPESLTKGFSYLLSDLANRGLISSIVVDEAHLIANWGVDFRVDYQVLGPLFRELSKRSPEGIRKVYLSGTFTQSTCDFIRSIFTDEKDTVEIINGSFLRPEIEYRLVSRPYSTINNALVTAIDLLPRPTIIYVNTPEQTKEIGRHLRQNGYSRFRLFSGTTITEERQRILALWNQNRLDIVVATTAFGAGMDKSDVRSIIQAVEPEDLDMLYQEAGRAGRDGRACISLTLVAPELTVDTTKKRLKAETAYQRWQGMVNSGIRLGNEFYVTLRNLRYGLRKHSNYNEIWNWQTLILMQRSGMADISFALNPELDELGGNDKWVQVSIKDDDHLKEANWVNLIGDLRQKDYQQDWSNKELYARWLGHNARWLGHDDTISQCEQLKQYYTVEGLSPELSCAGCPNCNKHKKSKRLPTLATMTDYVTINPQGSYHKFFEQQHGYSVRYVAASIPRLLRKWKVWIEKLIHLGIVSEIKASATVLDKLGQTLHPKLPFWVSTDLKEEFDLYNNRAQLILVTEEDGWVLDHLPMTPYIILAPDNISLSDATNDPWWVRDADNMELNTFLARINYVHH